MTSNERIGQALNSKNLRSDEHHADIDVVAALAFTSKLGASLQHLRSGGQYEEIGDSINLLAITFSRSSRRKRIGVNVRDAEIISKQALLEWMIQICKTCNGTGNSLNNYGAPTVTTPKRNSNDSCYHCSGSGMFMPAWSWRKSQMKLTGDVSREWWEKRIEFAKEIANDAYTAARRKVSVQMTELDQ